jgi:4-amino-4-deoxy-L-arabinose transferase-like glycosyltransferase
VHDSTACQADGSVRERWDRWFRVGAILVLAVAAVNLCFRLDREVVTEWDEALYAISAAETARNGNWIGTTLGGTLDYYNTKPPLNIWLIALSFKAFGINLVTLRAASALAAWLTVLVLMLWARRAFGAVTALLAGLVLSATYGFIYVHSARSANTDALFTLFVLLVVVTLWTARDHPRRLAWLGPILAAVFLLRGMAVLMPLALIGVVQILDLRKLRERWLPLSVATVLLALPVAGWVFARWQVDEWRFLERMFHYDFVARSARALEGHTGSPVYYLNVLQKDQYDWLLAATGAIVLFPISLAAVRQRLAQSTRDRYFAIVLASWIAVTLLIPTAMRTKVAWYLNPFFPVFALLVAVTLARGLGAAGAQLRRRQRVLAGLVLLALAVAEGKLIWYSYNMRDLNFSAQGILLDERERLAGQRVFRDRWPSGGRFILEQIVGGEAMQAHVEQDFRKKGDRGDFLLLTRSQVAYSQLSCPRTNHRYALCRYPD